MTSRGPESRPGEFELIAKLFAPLARNAPGALGLSDDVALFAPPDGHDVVLKTDAIVESVDFFHDDPADGVAQKALRVNLSDLAAKGAVPAGYLLTLLLPEWPDGHWLEKFAQGLSRDQDEFSIAVVGGDISATPGPLAISITAFGCVPSGTLIRRAGARPGDRVFVSGTIGDSAGGLSVLKGQATAEAYSDLVSRYRRPQPRLGLGQALRGVASAALDVSDGLVADLGHLAHASRVEISIESARLPLSPELLSLWGDSFETRSRAAVAGDDYEIAFTAPEQSRNAVLQAARGAGIAVTEIGQVREGAGVRLLDATGRDVSLPRKGFTHF